MNSKILSFLTGLLAIFAAILILMVGNYQQKVKQAENEFTLSNDFYPIQIPKIYGNGGEYREQIKDLNWVANKTGINYLKRQRFIGWKMKNNKIDYNKPVQSIEFQMYTVKATKIMKNFGDKPQLISKETKNIGTHLPGHSVRLIPIKNTVVNSQSREGTFFLETKDRQKIQRFIELLVLRLNKRSNQKLQKSDFKLVDQNNIEKVNFNGPDQLSLLAKVILAFLVIFLIMYQLSNSKKLAIYKLNGFSIYKSFMRSSGKMWLGSMSAIFLIDLLCWNFGKLRWGLETFLGQIGTFIAIPLISFTLIEMLQEMSFTNQINSKDYNRFNFIILYCIKGAALVLCFFSLVPLAQLSTGAYTNAIQANGNSKQNKYGVFYPTQIGNNLEQHTLEDGQKLDDLMYPSLNKKGAIIIDDSDIHQKIPEAIKFVKVNPNYLKLYPLYDNTGKKISISEKDNSIVLCLPEFRKKYKKQLIKYVRYTANDELGYIPKVKVYFTLPAKNRNFKDINNGLGLDKKTLFITTSKNSSFVERNIMNGQGEGDGLKIPIKSSVNEAYKMAKPLLTENNYIDNYPQLVKLSDISKEQLKLDIGNVVAQITVILTGLVITFILISYVTLLFFKVFKYSIVIKKINGFSRRLAYKELWLLTLCQYVIMLLIAGAQKNINLNTLILLSLTVVIELVINLITIINLEKKNIGDVLNGE
ncbi:hypothetical protein LFYK43_20230 [Ligilactobacillus salitolerans]|uniref:Bacteriocin-associated integral membrane protein n=1 Tax=Ligilactobacillus salitolerans TaxID=1808352 RepID=A0A401IVJ9_9LACO|nr:DUF1430 domain-containing protein [Ligilactobacillus salitolerans]GBG95564.1 hypothetical protein LFYK43_20230 [Ligilactobacillus salitolerans]